MNILLALSLSHLLNDTIQSLIPAIYPVLKDSFWLSYAQIGLITFVFQMTGSLLQPLVGYYTDRRPKPYSLAVGMGAQLGATDGCSAWKCAPRHGHADRPRGGFRVTGRAWLLR